MAKPSVKANLSLSIYGEPLAVSVDVPVESTTTRKLLPIFRSISHSIISATVKHAENAGRTISCKVGCAACCRQMIPISPTEAIRLKEIFNELPIEKKTVVSKKFEVAIDALKEAGLLDKLRAEVKPKGSDYKEIGLAYLKQGIACPFLEDESCSIHRERPLVCREYLVVSPAENCSRINGQPVEVIKAPYEVSKTVAAINGPKEFTNWIPLTLALEWAEKHPESDVERPGNEIAAEFFNGLLKQDS